MEGGCDGRVLEHRLPMFCLSFRNEEPVWWRYNYAGRRRRGGEYNAELNLATKRERAGGEVKETTQAV